MSAQPNQDASPTPTVKVLIARLHDAGFATAQRSAANLTYGLGLLGSHLKTEKDSKWQGQTAWILDGLKYNAMDGLDVLLALDKKDIHEYKQSKQLVASASTIAKQALLSTPSPLGGAIALQKHIGSFTGKCVEIAGQLQTMLEGNAPAETLAHQSSHRTEVEKNKHSESKKGL